VRRKKREGTKIKRSQDELCQRKKTSPEKKLHNARPTEKTNRNRDEGKDEGQDTVIPSLSGNKRGKHQTKIRTTPKRESSQRGN